MEGWEIHILDQSLDDSLPLQVSHKQGINVGPRLANVGPRLLVHRLVNVGSRLVNVGPRLIAHVSRWLAKVGPRFVALKNPKNKH